MLCCHVAPPHTVLQCRAVHCSSAQARAAFRERATEPTALGQTTGDPPVCPPAASGLKSKAPGGYHSSFLLHACHLSLACVQQRQYLLSACQCSKACVTHAKHRSVCECCCSACCCCAGRLTMMTGCPQTAGLQAGWPSSPGKCQLSSPDAAVVSRGATFIQACWRGVAQSLWPRLCWRVDADQLLGK